MRIDPAPTRKVRRLGSGVLFLLVACLAVSTISPLAAAAAETLDFQKPERTKLNKMQIKTHLTAESDSHTLP